jgi:hypothetical protein
VPQVPVSTFQPFDQVGMACMLMEICHTQNLSPQGGYGKFLPTRMGWHDRIHGRL